MGMRILRGRLKASATSFAKNRVDDCLLSKHSPETKQADALSE
ncbi:hypothetical protein [Neisseria sicca]|nr:hypothetical protein [Neisseria sicca]